MCSTLGSAPRFRASESATDSTQGLSTSLLPSSTRLPCSRGIQRPQATLRGSGSRLWTVPQPRRWGCWRRSLKITLWTSIPAARLHTIKWFELLKLTAYSCISNESEQVQRCGFPAGDQRDSRSHLECEIVLDVWCDPCPAPTKWFMPRSYPRLCLIHARRPRWWVKLLLALMSLAKSCIGYLLRIER